MNEHAKVSANRFIRSRAVSENTNTISILSIQIQSKTEEVREVKRQGNTAYL
jgi:hypothetical protein